jgi:hypothetical protein
MFPGLVHIMEHGMDSDVARILTDQRAQFASGPRARQKKYESLVSEAIAQGHYGQMVWAELARDYNAAIATVLTLWHQVDSNFSSRN